MGPNIQAQNEKGMKSRRRGKASRGGGGHSSSSKRPVSSRKNCGKHGETISTGEEKEKEKKKIPAALSPVLAGANHNFQKEAHVNAEENFQSQGGEREDQGKRKYSRFARRNCYFLGAKANFC